MGMCAGSVQIQFVHENPHTDPALHKQDEMCERHGTFDQSALAL